MYFFYNLGSSELARISCANHKVNLCIRTALAKHKPLNSNIRSLNAYVARIKRSTELNKVFADAESWNCSCLDEYTYGIFFDNET